MGAPVVHWEILSKNAEGLQKFFGELFDWHVDTNNPQGYGLVDTHSDKGIPGGIGAPQQGDGWVTVYVMVEDLQATLDRAESLGGRTIMPPMDVAPDVKLAILADPEGHPIGLTQGS
jgi:predicted enzyme related to lactoylglutathione lyase